MRQLLTALLLLLPLSARAVDLKTIESDYIWDTYFSSFTSVTSKTVDIAGYGTIGYSTRTPNVIGFAYSLYPVGSSATFNIAQTTRVFSSAGSISGFNNSFPTGLSGSISAASLSTSTQISVPTGLVYNGKFQALTMNPVFNFSLLSAAATYYLYVEIGRQKRP